MADDYKVQIGINADESKLANIEQRLKAIERPATLTINSNLSQVSTQIADIEKRLKNLRNTGLNINLGGSGGSGSRSRRDNSTNDFFNDAMYYQRKINATKVQLVKANEQLDVFGVDTLTSQLKDYENLFGKANQYYDSFSAKQRNRLKRLQDEGGNSLTLANDRSLDQLTRRTSAEFDRKYSQAQKIYGLLNNGSIDNKISDLNFRRSKIGSTSAIDSALGSNGTAGTISELRKSLSDAFSDGSAFTDAGMEKAIETFEKLNNEIELTSNNLKTLKRNTSQEDVSKSAASSANKLLEKAKSAYSSKQIENDMSKMEDAYKKLGGDSTNLTKNTSLYLAMSDLRREKTSLSNKLILSAPDDEIIASWNRYTDALEKAKNLTAIQSRTDDGATAKRNLKIAEGFKEKISSGETSGEISALTQQLEKLSASSDEITKIKSNLAELSSITSSVDNNASVDVLVEKQQQYNRVLQETKAALKGVQENQDVAFKKQKMSNDIEAYLKKNTAAVKKYGAALKELQKEYENATDSATLKKLDQKYTLLKGTIKAEGLTGLSFEDQLKESVTKLLPALSAVDLVRRGVDTLKQMAQETVSVDTAMTELKRVTSLSATEYENLYDSMTQSAKKYGAQLDTMINSTASWVRLGFDANTANKLAEISTMYQHVTDLDEGTAVKNLVTAYQGYKDQLLATTNNDSVAAIEKVADIFDKLGNELPVTAAQVGAGMNKWASVAQSAGATIEEAAAMTVGGGSVTQDFEQTGSALKIATLRIQGMKGELEALGEEVDDNISSVSKIQTQILNLTKGKVNIFEDDGKSFRNIYEIFRDIANILPQLDDTDRSKLLETIAGKNRSNSILAMLQNWEEVERALTAANDASGTAREENDIYMDSIQGKIDSLKASWQALSNTVVDSNILKRGLDLINGIVDGLDAVVGKIGPIMTIIAGGTAIKSVKSIS